MVRISEVSFKIFKIARFYDFLDHITTTITTGYLQKFQDGLQILAVRGLSQSKKFLRKNFMPAFMFLRIYEDFRWFIYEIRTSGGHNVRFRHSAPLSKTFALMCTALRLLK